MIVDHRGTPFPPQAEPEMRLDNWQNPLTGIGGPNDKVNGNHGRFFPVYRVLDQELTSMHSGSDLAAHVVDRRPKEMFRRGYDLEADGISASQTEDIREYAAETLDLDTNMREGFRWGRLYGGCLLLLNVDDGGFPWEPLDEDNIRSFNSVSLVDRRYAYVQSQYSSMNAAHYGRPEIYLISNAVAVSGWNSHGSLRKKSGWELMKEGGQATLVHESRVIRFDGNDADIVTRQQLAGWSWSVLQRVYDAMRQFEHAYDSVGYLLGDASQGVFKLQGLLKAITSGQRTAFTTRLQLMEMSRSVMRGIALDAGNGKDRPAEEFTRVGTPFGSIPELLDRMMLRFSAAAEEPATILFGRAPGGLNASGDNEIRSWYDTIASEQTNEATPRLKRCYRLLALAKNGPIKGGKNLKFKVTHKPLWSPTDKETADTLFVNAQRDNLYLTQGVVKPEEVAVDLGDVYPNLDVAAREAVLKSNESFDPYSGDPEPKPVGPVTPTSASGVNGTAGEPIGGPQVPMPLLGGGSIGAAKPSKGKPPASLGNPGQLRPPAAKAIVEAQGRNYADGYDPRQPRERGKLSSHRATSLGVEAYDLGDAAADIENHHEAATAHAHAALEFRQLAARASRLGNAAAAKRHEIQAGEHDGEATAHTMRAGALGGVEGGESSNSLPKADTFDPEQARNEHGEWSEEGAVGASREANKQTTASIVSRSTGGGFNSIQHNNAAKAHRLAAEGHQQLAERHEKIGNTKAAEMHRALAEEHTENAESHAEKIQKVAPRAATAGPVGGPKASKSAAAYKGHETRGENEHNVTANIDPHERPLWEKTKAQYKGTPHERFEKFSEYSKANPREVAHALNEHSEKKLNAMIREYQSRPAA